MDCSLPGCPIPGILQAGALEWGTIAFSAPQPQPTTNLLVYFLCCFYCLSRVRLLATPWTQHTRPPCPSPSPGACSNSCPLSQGCHPTISSSVIPFFCPQSFSASGSVDFPILFHVNGVFMWPLCVAVLLNVVCSSIICVVVRVRTSFFSWLSHTPLCGWTARVTTGSWGHFIVPPFDWSEWCCCKHSCTRFCADTCFHLSQYQSEWNFWDTR